MTKYRTKRNARADKGRTGESYSIARRAVLDPEVPRSSVRVFLDERCANCLERLPQEEEGLFCSAWCRETTKHVRYFRRVFRDGRIEQPDVQKAVQIRLAFLPSGGYNALSRNLSPKTREEVKSRDSGRCQVCGGEGIEIDHISGSSSGLSNLQLVCIECHHKKTAKSMVSASDETRALIGALFTDRVQPEDPMLLADDENSWNGIWRKLKSARRQRLLDELGELGIDTDGLTDRAEMIVLRDDVISESYGSDEAEEFDPEVASSDDGGFGPNSYFARAMERDD